MEAQQAFVIALVGSLGALALGCSDEAIVGCWEEEPGENDCANQPGATFGGSSFTVKEDLTANGGMHIAVDGTCTWCTFDAKVDVAEDYDNTYYADITLETCACPNGGSRKATAQCLTGGGDEDHMTCTWSWEGCSGDTTKFRRTCE